VTTVEEIVSTMEQRYGLAHRIWVMDRGMTSAENVAWLQQTGRRYSAPSQSELRRWAQAMADTKDWQDVREGVEAKLCCGPDGSETFLLCRSRLGLKARIVPSLYSFRFPDLAASNDSDCGGRLPHRRRIEGLWADFGIGCPLRG
jgi:hypothetical protein